MPVENQALRARALAEKVVAQVHIATTGDVVFSLQVIGIACGMIVSAAFRAGHGEFAKQTLVKAQIMGADWQGNPIEVIPKGG